MDAVRVEVGQDGAGAPASTTNRQRRTYLQRMGSARGRWRKKKEASKSLTLSIKGRDDAPLTASLVHQSDIHSMGLKYDVKNAVTLGSGQTVSVER